jgi:hypothetical protein
MAPRYFLSKDVQAVVYSIDTGARKLDPLQTYALSGHGTMSDVGVCGRAEEQVSFGTTDGCVLFGSEVF